MNGADYLIIGVLGLSILLGMVRGFVREAIALMGWLGGLWIAWRYAPLLEPLLGGMIGEPPVSTWAARVLIVMAVLIVAWLLAGVLTYFLQHSGLSLMVDRLLGMLFGFVRGAVVVAVFVLLGQFVELDKVEWWQESDLLPYAAELAGWIHTFAETGAKELEAQSTAMAAATGSSSIPLSVGA